MTAISLLVGWVIGFGGPVIFPGTPWFLWVMVGSALTGVIYGAAHD